MKKLLGIIVITVFTSVFYACSVDTESEATATLSYYGQCDSVVFTDSADTVYAKYIIELINSKLLPLVGENSHFTETVTTNDDYIENAIYNCNIRATKTYENMINNAKSAYFRNMLASSYASIDFSQLNIFSIYYSLYGFYKNDATLVGSLKMEY